MFLKTGKFRELKNRDGIIRDEFGEDGNFSIDTGGILEFQGTKIATQPYVQSWMPPALEEDGGVARIEVMTINDPVFDNPCNTLSNGSGNNGRLALASGGIIRMVFGGQNGFYFDGGGGNGSFYYNGTVDTPVANFTIQSTDTIFNKDINLNSNDITNGGTISGSFIATGNITGTAGTGDNEISVGSTINMGSNDIIDVANLTTSGYVEIDGEAEPDSQATTTFTPILRLQQGQAFSNPDSGAQISFGYNGTDTFQHFINTVHNSQPNNNSLNIYVCNGMENNSLQNGVEKIFSYGTPASISYKPLDMNTNDIINVGSISLTSGTITTTASSGTDIANKDYVDTQITGATQGADFHNSLSSIPENDSSDKITGVDIGFGVAWGGGVLAPNGKIYGIPRSSDSVLIIDPENDTANTTDITFTGNGSCEGGVLAPNGKIYGIPNANTGLIIDPEAETIDNTSISNLGEVVGSGTWAGGVLASNGKIYGVPHRSDNVIIINPDDDSADTTSITGVGTSDQKWFGGVLAPNGKIYCMPHMSESILVIDTTAIIPTSTIALPSAVAGNLKWVGGVLAPNGKIYGIPYNSTVILVIDTASSDNISTIDVPGPSPSDLAKWHGGILAPNGKIYGIPSKSNYILLINPDNDTATVIDSDSGAANRGWFGGVLAPNGKIYGIPYDSSSILMIKTGLPKLPLWMLDAPFNKF